ARVEFIDSPKIKPNETKKIRITYYNKTQQSQNISFRFILPEGWKLEGNHAVMLESRGAALNMYETWEADVTAGEQTVHINRLIIEVTSNSHMITGYIPILFVG
ncbi:MAG TPA: hypothetical protein PLH71_01700, partial [Clostridia bacterium]|nr:hypothetical protein [Clostridia bacterium]